jgi:hypothetical protein
MQLHGNGEKVDRMFVLPPRKTTCGLVLVLHSNLHIQTHNVGDIRMVGNAVLQKLDIFIRQNVLFF